VIRFCIQFVGNKDRVFLVIIVSYEKASDDYTSFGLQRDYIFKQIKIPLKF
jgi:hypothetical protein